MNTSLLPYLEELLGYDKSVFFTVATTLNEIKGTHIKAWVANNLDLTVYKHNIEHPVTSLDSNLFIV